MLTRSSAFNGLVPSIEIFPKARAAAQKALDIDSVVAGRKYLDGLRQVVP